MDEQHEMNVRRPVDGVPWRRARPKTTEHGKKRIALEHSARVKSERAAALKDDVARRGRFRPGFGIRDSGFEGSWFVCSRCAGVTRRCDDFIDDRPLNVIGAQTIGASEPRTVPCSVDENLWLLVLGIPEVRLPIEAEQPSNLRVGPFRQELHPPAEHRSCEAKRAKGMAGVVLAVAKCSFAVFPGLAPDDRRQRDKKIIRGPIGYYTASLWL